MFKNTNSVTLFQNSVVDEAFEKKLHFLFLFFFMCVGEIETEKKGKRPKTYKLGFFKGSGAAPGHQIFTKCCFSPAGSWLRKKFHHNDGIRFRTKLKSSYFPSFKDFLRTPPRRKWTPKTHLRVRSHENGLISPEPATLHHETIRKQVFLPKKTSRRSLFWQKKNPQNRHSFSGPMLFPQQPFKKGFLVDHD